MIKLPDNDSNKKTKSSGIRKPSSPYRNSLILLKLFSEHNRIYLHKTAGT